MFFKVWKCGCAWSPSWQTKMCPRRNGEFWRISGRTAVVAAWRGQACSWIGTGEGGGKASGRGRVVSAGGYEQGRAKAMIEVAIRWSMNSPNFSFGVMESFLPWVSPPAFVISLQSPQGCSPERVFSRAVPIESWRAKSRTMVVQAKPCRTARCPPTERKSATPIIAVAMERKAGIVEGI